MARPVYVKLSNDRYCFTCGTMVKRSAYIAHYIEETGEPVMNETRQCPNKKWISIYSHPVTETEAYCEQ